MLRKSRTGKTLNKVSHLLRMECRRLTLNATPLPAPPVFPTAELTEHKLLTFKE